MDEIVSTSPLELYVVTFESQYYTTTQGRKKLKQVEQKIQKLTSVRHPKLITVFAVTLHAAFQWSASIDGTFGTTPSIDFIHDVWRTVNF